MRALIAGVVAALLGGGTAAAHDSDFSLLVLRVEGARVSGAVEIQLRDAQIAVGLPETPGDEAWPALRARTPALRARLERGLGVASQDGACALRSAERFEAAPDGRAALRLPVEALCPGEVAQLQLEYRVLSDLDPAHRGYFQVEDARLTHVGVFSAEQPQVRLAIHRLDRWRSFVDYAREGVWHIWTGWDHALFLLALLLPAPLLREGRVWRPRQGIRGTLREVVAVVTAFTLAHSVTLGVSVLGVVALPPRAVETGIALSVGIAAWNNLRPFLPGRAAWLAAGFGLLHGFGFAGALSQLGLPRQARGIALLGFNVGVEAGQLAIVAVVVPLLYAARTQPGYERGVLGVGSFAIAWLAVVWALERALGVALLRGA